VSSWPPPTRKDHQRFCEIEGWSPVRDARGRAGTHHVTYELALPDGRVLRTRISHPVDRSDYGPSLWVHALRDQLDVSAAEFWACLGDGEPPARSRQAVPTSALPADLAHLLISRVGLSDADVARMSRDEAVARMQRYWTEGS
jgi:hypothetical protein